MKKNILIIGGGFGGAVAARKLSNLPDTKISLLSNLESFRYNPALYRVATGHRKRVAIIPLKDILPGNVEFIKGVASNIDRKRKVLTLKNKTELAYDTIILSMGVVTSYFNIPGLKEHSFGIKSITELDELHQHIHDDLVGDKQFDKNYVVVGGGPTGVELAADLGNHLRRLAKQHRIRKRKVSLKIIEAQPRILSQLDPRLSKKATARLKHLGVQVETNKKVEYETTRTLRVDNQSIPTQTVIWTAGTTNSSFFENNKAEFELSKRGKVIVNDYLQVDKHTYVIGDNAESKYSGLAQTAIHQARFVANNIERQLNDTPLKAYKPLRPVSIIPVGNNWAVLQYGALNMAGKIPGMLRIAADIIGYADIMGMTKSIKLWRGDSLPAKCQLCGDQPSEEPDTA